jgi:hypothetical protein
VKAQSSVSSLSPKQQYKRALDGQFSNIEAARNINFYFGWGFTTNSVGHSDYGEKYLPMPKKRSRSMYEIEKLDYNRNNPASRRII